MKKNNKPSYDSYTNVAKGWNGNNDPLKLTTFNANTPIQRQEAEDMYRYNWITRRGVDCYPEDAMREWINIQVPDQNMVTDINNRLDDINARWEIKKGLRLGRLYGGAVTVIGALDGQDPVEPLNEENIERLSFLNTFDRWQIYIDEYYTDPLKSNFGYPKVYAVMPINAKGISIVSGYNRVHESRVIKWDGEFLPDIAKLQNMGWYESILTSVGEAVRNYSVAEHAGAVLFQDFITKVLKMPGLRELIANKNFNSLEARIQFAIANMSTLGITLIEEDEEFTKIQTPITGLVELIDKYMDIISGAFRIPKARLFSQQLGRTSGAEESTRTYYDDVRNYQNQHLRKPIERLIDLVFLEKKGITSGKKPERWTFDFNPLWQESDETKAKNRNIQAQSDQIYLQNNVLSPEEIAINRFSENGFSYDTNIDLDLREKYQDNPGKEASPISKEPEPNTPKRNTPMTPVEEKTQSGFGESGLTVGSQTLPGNKKDESELQKGIKEESEHKITLLKIVKAFGLNPEDAKVKEVIESAIKGIAETHIEKLHTYYTELKAMEAKAK